VNPIHFKIGLEHNTQQFTTINLFNIIKIVGGPGSDVIEFLL